MLMLLAPVSSAKNNGQKVQECTLQNGIKVVLHEDFKMPMVIIGIVFHISKADTPPNKFGLIDIIGRELINSELYDIFFSLGINYLIGSNYFCIQIAASMNPKNARDFFAQMYKVMLDISVEDLEIYKKQLALKYKLSSYCGDDALSNNIAANVRLSNGYTLPMFQEQELNSITESDVKLFYRDNFCHCPVTVVVSGAIGYKSLLKILHNSLGNLPPRKRRSAISLAPTSFNNVLLKNKFMSNTISYAYILSPDDNVKFGNFFDSLLRHEMIKYFNGIYPIVDCSVIDLLQNGCSIKLINMAQESYVSLEKLDDIYRAFIRRICTLGISPESLERIAAQKERYDLVISTDLEEVYSNMLYDSLSNRGVDGTYSSAEGMRAINLKEFRAFLEKFFQQNALFKIMTKFELDN
jgi:predicted Zn-dependent peptidase